MSRRRVSLRGKIIVYASSLLIALTIAMLAYVNFQAEQFVNRQIETDLREGRERVVQAVQDRLEDLQLTASLVASFPELKALFQYTDTATIRDFLLSYQQSTGRSEVLIVLDQSRRVIARTDRSDPQPIPGIDQSPDGVLRADAAFFQYSTAASEAAGELFGFVVAAAPMDDSFARDLASLTNSDVVIIGDRVVGSSRVAGELPWQVREDWVASIPGDGSLETIEVGGEDYAASGTMLGNASGLQPIAVVMQSHDRAMQPYRRIQIGLLALGGVIALIGTAGSAWFARTVTAPVAKLVKGTQEVAAGNFDSPLDIRSRDEIGDLAASFNVMMQGLRERADMQKFVSQSTVEMIQSTSQKKVSAGEKVRLTILFSDMRGFTAMAERKPPEDIVRLLNTCLSLQAEKVKKFNGDIDKFIGDCVVALFDGDDMELHAIRCAVEIHKALDALNAANPEEEPLHVGVGIATGEVILGSIGSADRLDYTVIGSHVNLSSRLCSLAGPGEIWIAQATYDKVEGLVAAEKLQPVQVKGFSERVPVYRMAVTPVRPQSS